MKLKDWAFSVAYGDIAMEQPNIFRFVDHASQVDGVFSKHNVRGEHTTIPEKHIPKDKIPLAFLQEIALDISMTMTRATSSDDVLKLHAKAIQEAKVKALKFGVVHLIDWCTFLLNT